MSNLGKTASLQFENEAEIQTDRFPWHPRRIKAGSKKEGTLIQMWNPYDEEYDGAPKPRPIRDRIDDAAWYQHSVHPELVVPYEDIVRRRSYVLRVCEEQIEHLETVPYSKHHFSRPSTRRGCEEILAYAEHRYNENFAVSGYEKECLDQEGIDPLYHSLEQFESYIAYVDDWEPEYDHLNPRTWNEFWESRFDWDGQEPSISCYEDDYISRLWCSYEIDGTVEDFEGRDPEAEDKTAEPFGQKDEDIFVSIRESHLDRVQKSESNQDAFELWLALRAR